MAVEESTILNLTKKVEAVILKRESTPDKRLGRRVYSIDSSRDIQYSMFLLSVFDDSEGPKVNLAFSGVGKISVLRTTASSL